MRLPPRPSPALLAALLAAAVPCAGPARAADERLDLHHVVLDLPGPPAKVLPWDVDGDGLGDLVAVVAFDEIEQRGEQRVEQLVHVTKVIPTLLERRELRLYRGQPGGGYAEAGTLPLPPSVLHLEAGPDGIGPVALTDEGLAVLRRAADGSLRLEPLLDRAPALAGTGSFFPRLELVHDLDGDGDRDLLFPAAEGLAVHLAAEGRLASQASSLVPVAPAEGPVRWYPLPEVRDVSGDGRPDLVFPWGLTRDRWGRIDVWLGAGDGRFRPLRETPRDCHDRGSDLRLALDDPALAPWPEDVVALRDVDGEGRAELVTRQPRPRGESLRKNMKDAKRPITVLRFHRLDERMDVVPEPYMTAEIVGHTGDGSEDAGSPFGVSQFVDLDGDGRDEMVTVTLEFSLWQALRVLVTKSIKIGMDFHVYAWTAGGRYREVPDLDLSEKMKFDLDDLSLGRMAQFAGDFDGDGRQDFVHLGRGRKVTIHRGGPGPSYPRKPDLEVRLDEEPPSLELVRIEDLDGDGRADIRLTRPLPQTDPDVRPPVRLDLYLSGGR